MKNGRRSAAIAALAMLLLFAGCKERGNAPAEIASAAPSQGESASGKNREPERSSAPEEEAAPFEAGACRAALEAVTEYELGSAGSSLKAVIAAAKLIEFTQTFDSSQEKELTAAVADYLGGLGEEQRAAFAEHLPVLEETAREILGKVPGIDERMEEAGSPLPKGDYSAERFDEAAAVIGAALGAKAAQ